MLECSAVLCKDSYMCTGNKSQEKCPSLDMDSSKMRNLPGKRKSLKSRIGSTDYHAFYYNTKDTLDCIFKNRVEIFQEKITLCFLQGLHPGGCPDRVTGLQKKLRTIFCTSPVLSWKGVLGSQLYYWPDAWSDHSLTSLYISCLNSKITPMAMAI